MGILTLLWKKTHLREKQWDKNNFPSSRFARWPGQRQALGCFLFKLARYDGNKKCIKRIVKAALSLVILPLFQFFVPEEFCDLHRKKIKNRLHQNVRKQENLCFQFWQNHHHMGKQIAKSIKTKSLSALDALHGAAFCSH